MNKRNFFTKLFSAAILAVLPKAKAAPQWEGCVKYQDMTGRVLVPDRYVVNNDLITMVLRERDEQFPCPPGMAPGSTTPDGNRESTPVK